MNLTDKMAQEHWKQDLSVTHDTEMSGNQPGKKKQSAVIEVLVFCGFAVRAFNCCLKMATNGM